MAGKMRWLSCYSTQKELLTIVPFSPTDSLHDIVRKIIKLPKITQERPFRIRKGALRGKSQPIVRKEFAKNAAKFFKEEDFIIIEFMSEEEAANYRVSYTRTIRK